MDIFNVPWVLLVWVSAVLGSFSGFLDNYTTDVLFSGRHPQAEKMFFGPLYIMSGLLILLVMQPDFTNLWPVLVLIGSGAVSSLGSIPYFAGMAKEEATAAKIFTQLTPVFNLILAWIFLGQAVAGQQFLAFAVILAAPLIVIFAKRKRSKMTSARAAGFFVIYSFSTALSSLLFVGGSAGMGEGANFWICLALMLVGKGATNLVVMGVMKKWREHFYRRMKKMGWKFFAVMGANFVIWGLADILFRLATVSSDTVALVSVSNEALGLIITFFLGLLLSLLWPNFGREKMERRTIRAHLIAIVVATIGILLIG